MAGVVAGISNLAVGPNDPRRRQTQAQSNPNATNATTPTPSEEQQLSTYYNAGRQNVKGLTNQTGYVKGNANGVINFGTVTASAAAQRQA